METFTIEITLHAVERFRERVRPALPLDAAEDELALLLTFAEVTAEAPAWMAHTTREATHAYAVIGDVVLPLAAGREGVLFAKTCIPRGGISPPARARRSDNRRARRRGSRFRRNRMPVA